MRIHELPTCWQNAARYRTPAGFGGPFAVPKWVEVMNFLNHNKTRLVGIVLLCAAIGSSALTLGRLRGAALLGQPLEVEVAVQAGPDEDVAGLCFQAEVFYADARVDPSRVRVKVEPAAQARGPSVRVLSSVKIDEPVVTVNLTAGCSQKTSRRYVVLAELASDMAVVTPTTSTPAPAPAPAVNPALASRSGSAAPAVAPAVMATRTQRLAQRRAPGPSRAVAAVPKAMPARQPLAQQMGDVGNPGRVGKRSGGKNQNRPRNQSQSQSSRADQSASLPKAHLKLDPAELAVTGDIDLRLSQQLDVAAIGNEKLRAEAIALWRAINAHPAEILRETQRVATLEGNITTLRALADKSQSTLADMTQRLQKAESARSSNAMAYALAAVAALALVAATYFWSRQRGKFTGEGNWWHSSNPAQESVNLNPVVREALPAHSGVAGAAGAVGAPLSAGLASARSSNVNVEDLDLDLSVAGPLESARHTIPVAKGLIKSPTKSQTKGLPKGAPRSGVATRPAAIASLPAAPPDSRGFAQSMGGALRAINTEELLDIRQQAEFFVSLGQHDHAIQILEARILEYGDSSPLVYLDLMKIFHALDRRSEFRQFQQDFNRRFNGRANDFYNFSDEGQGLADYPAALARLTALWPSEAALEFMEDCIFRTPDADSGQSFDLAAFRELLMLHLVARDLDSANIGPGTSGHARLTRGPKVNADTVVSPAVPMVPANASLRYSAPSLDIDLDWPS